MGLTFDVTFHELLVLVEDLGVLELLLGHDVALLLEDVVVLGGELLEDGFAAFRPVREVELLDGDHDLLDHAI